MALSTQYTLTISEHSIQRPSESISGRFEDLLRQSEAVFEAGALWERGRCSQGANDSIEVDAPGESRDAAAGKLPAPNSDGHPGVSQGVLNRPTKPAAC
jgi:hypothetical protein